uniref:Uncharacterized protein n=1 Tax=Micrurus spixii TaxID=129469 RepID=A0A2D4LAG9_9SAUR
MWMLSGSICEVVIGHNFTYFTAAVKANAVLKQMQLSLTKSIISNGDFYWKLEINTGKLQNVKNCDCVTMGHCKQQFAKHQKYNHMTACVETVVISKLGGKNLMAIFHKSEWLLSDSL